jgi:hypothetical protein
MGMADIVVTSLKAGRFRVVVAEAGSATTHEVTVPDAAGSAAGTSPERLVEASFRFLLDREPQESILGSFDLSAIERYFPEYPEQIADYL